MQGPQRYRCQIRCLLGHIVVEMVGMVDELMHGIFCFFFLGCGGCGVALGADGLMFVVAVVVVLVVVYW